MQKNVGNLERVARIAVGLVLISMAFVGPESPWFFLGTIPLLTGLVGWCPPYAMLGITTAKACSSDANRAKT